MKDHQQSLRDWLALVHAPDLGPASILSLLEHFSTPTQLLAAGRRAWHDVGLNNKTIAYLSTPDWVAVDKDLGWAEQAQAHIISIEDPAYPDLLRQINQPPLVLYILGNPAVLSEWQLAVVGSRNPTAGGKDNALEFSRYLGEMGMVISSGLALGIDAEAHRGALKGGGRTIAVAGTGLDRVYPARHRDLAHQIAESGALISEFPVGMPPLPHHFPRRNRIISGLSLGVLVVEAALKSGSLITARQALEQGREVFAIPGSIHNPLAKGCHALIREGAKLVETAQDILEELSALAGVKPRQTSQDTDAQAVLELDKAHQQLLQNVGFEPTSVDQVVQRSGLTADAVCSMLLVLELQGYVQAVSGGYYCQCRQDKVE